MGYSVVHDENEVRLGSNDLCGSKNRPMCQVQKERLDKKSNAF